jgi:hypothetical protein
MKLFKIINTECDYIEMLSRSISLLNAKPGTSGFEERQLLLALMKDYEHRLVQNSQHCR